MSELQKLCSRTLRSPPSVSRARKRSLGDWVFRDSRARVIEGVTSPHTCDSPPRWEGSRRSRSSSYEALNQSDCLMWQLDATRFGSVKPTTSGAALGPGTELVDNVLARHYD